MPIMIEEIIKINKDKVLEQQYKDVRQALKLNLFKYIAEERGGILEKSIETFVGKLNKEEDTGQNNKIGYDIGSATNLGGRKIYTLPSRKNSDMAILDQLLKISDDMSTIFDGFEKLEGGRLRHKIGTVGIVNISNFIDSIKNAKLNCFPRHVEPISYGLSEEQEIKAIIPRSTFKTIKLMVDKYYYLFRLISMNQFAGIAFQKLGVFRDNLHLFEYSIFYYLNKLKDTESNNSATIGSYTREIKAMLLHYKKFIEAMYESDFSKLVNTLTDLSQEAGMRIFIQYNAKVDSLSGITRVKEEVNLAYSLMQFDETVKPILRLVETLDFSRSNKIFNSIGKKQEVFWAISAMIEDFKHNVNCIINEFLKIIPQTNADFKYFIHTIQSFILPYISQQKGEVSETFVAGIKNINVFYWKLMLRIIERSFEEEFQFSDLLGLQVHVLNEDVIKYKEDMKRKAELRLANRQLAT